MSGRRYKKTQVMKRRLASCKPEDKQAWMTAGELTLFLGISRSTFKRWRKTGQVPEPGARTPQGWGLWSPATVTEILRKIA